jgi:hypothetical protein
LGQAPDQNCRLRRRVLESPDGDYLYFRRNGFKEIWRKPVKGGLESFVVNTGPVNSWTIGRRGIYFGDPEVGIVFYSLADKRISPVATFADSQIGSLALSPDGSWPVYGRRDRVASDVMIVEDFR